MAILDGQLKFDSARSLSNNTTVNSTNVIDLAITRGFNTTRPLLFYIFFTGTPAGTTLSISLISSASPSLTSPRYHWSTGVITKALQGGTGYTLAGFTSGANPILIAMPHSYFNPNLVGITAGTAASAPYLQYLGVEYASTGDNSAGTVTSGLTQVIDMVTNAASGYTLSQGA